MTACDCEVNTLRQCDYAIHTHTTSVQRGSDALPSFPHYFTEIRVKRPRKLQIYNVTFNVFSYYFSLHYCKYYSLKQSPKDAVSTSF